MTITIRVIIDGHESVEEVAHFERGALQPRNVGLTLAEGKSLLGCVQRTMVAQQTVAWVAEHGRCVHCGTTLRRNGHRTIVLRTVFGKLRLENPRLYLCACQGPTRESFSPLAELLLERTTPELRYLQTKWASLSPMA